MLWTTSHRTSEFAIATPFLPLTNRVPDRPIEINGSRLDEHNFVLPKVLVPWYFVSGNKVFFLKSFTPLENCTGDLGIASAAGPAEHRTPDWNSTSVFVQRGCVA